jgi:hypothetical protein
MTKSMMIKQTIQLIGVTYKEFLRNPGIIFWAVLFPILMAWGLGLAFTNQNQLVKNAAWIKNAQGSTVLDSSEDKMVVGNELLGFTTYRLIESTEERSPATDEARQGGYYSRRVKWHPGLSV